MSVDSPRICNWKTIRADSSDGSASKIQKRSKTQVLQFQCSHPSLNHFTSNNYTAHVFFYWRCLTKKIWSDKVKINNDFSYLGDICFDECVNNLNDKLKSFNKHASGCCKSIPLPIDQVGLCTPFCSIKWVPTTKWVCTPQLLVSTKWLHTPSDVLMFNVLLEWVCNPFCRKWVYRHVCSPRWFLQNRWWKLSRSTNSLSTSKEELYKIWHWVLRGGSIYKMGSTLQNGVAQPHLPSKPSGYHWIRYPFYFAHDPIHFSPPWSCPLAVGHFTWKSRIPFRKLKVESRSIPIWCYKVCTNSPGKQR